MLQSVTHSPSLKDTACFCRSDTARAPMSCSNRRSDDNQWRAIRRRSPYDKSPVFPSCRGIVCIEHAICEHCISNAGRRCSRISKERYPNKHRDRAMARRRILRRWILRTRMVRPGLGCGCRITRWCDHRRNARGSLLLRLRSLLRLLRCAGLLRASTWGCGRLLHAAVPVL